MTRTTVPAEPLRVGGQGQKWAVIADGAIGGAYRLPTGALRVIALYNRAHAAFAEAEREYLDRFPARWLDRAPDARGRAVARTLLTGDGPVELPDDLIAPIEASQAVERGLDLRRHTLAATADESVRLLEGLMAEPTILPCLRDALDEILEGVRGIPDVVPMSAESALDADPGAQDAYRRLITLYGRYQAVRQAQDALRAHYPSKDTGGLFLTTPVEPRTDRIASLGARPERAGPPDGLARLRWLAEPGHAWLPTAAEQDEKLAGWLEKVSDTLAVRTLSTPARHILSPHTVR
jgi:hypothetical protein